MSTISCLYDHFLNDQLLPTPHLYFLYLVEAAGGRVDAIYDCPHTSEDGWPCRKPRSGLLERAEREGGFALAGAPFVGDRWTDVEAALATGARPILLGEAPEDGTGAYVKNVERHHDLSGFVHAYLKAEEQDGSAR